MQIEFRGLEFPIELRVLLMWEETGALRVNPQQHMENIQGPQRKGLKPNHSAFLLRGSFHSASTFEKVDKAELRLTSFSSTIKLPHHFKKVREKQAFISISLRLTVLVKHSRTVLLMQEVKGFLTIWVRAENILMMAGHFWLFRRRSVAP